MTQSQELVLDAQYRTFHIDAVGERRWVNDFFTLLGKEYELTEVSSLEANQLQRRCVRIRGEDEPTEKQLRAFCARHTYGVTVKIS